MLLYPDIFNYLMFYPTQLGSTHLSDYKNAKAYSYYQSGWLQPLYFHKLFGSKYCIFKGECRQSQRILYMHAIVHAWLAWASLVTMLQLLCIELNQQSDMD